MSNEKFNALNSLRDAPMQLKVIGGIIFMAAGITLSSVPGNAAESTSKPVAVTARDIKHMCDSALWLNRDPKTPQTADTNCDTTEDWEWFSNEYISDKVDLLLAENPQRFDYKDYSIVPLESGDGWMVIEKDTNYEG